MEHAGHAASPSWLCPFGGWGLERVLVGERVIVVLLVRIGLNLLDGGSGGLRRCRWRGGRSGSGSRPRNRTGWRRRTRRRRVADAQTRNVGRGWRHGLLALFGHHWRVVRTC
ncbi:hypothetical protein CH063_15349, partial [Colletotrichum higginsianum]